MLRRLYETSNVSEVSCHLLGHHLSVTEHNDSIFYTYDNEMFFNRKTSSNFGKQIRFTRVALAKHGRAKKGFAPLDLLLLHSNHASLLLLTLDSSSKT